MGALIQIKAESLNNSSFFQCVCAVCTTGMLLSQVSDMTYLINGVTQPANIIPTTKSVSPAGPQREGTCSRKSKEAKLVSRLLNWLFLKQALLPKLQEYPGASPSQQTNK